MCLLFLDDLSVFDKKKSLNYFCCCICPLLAITVSRSGAARTLPSDASTSWRKCEVLLLGAAPKPRVYGSGFVK